MSNDELLARRGLAALEAMGDIWGAEINLKQMAKRIAEMEEPRREETIAAMIEQGFIEGAYRCLCDAKDGKIQSLSIPVGWQVVPREPTAKMVQEGWDVEELKTPDRIYSAMLNAAPERPNELSSPAAEGSPSGARG